MSNDNNGQGTEKTNVVATTTVAMLPSGRKVEVETVTDSTGWMHSLCEAVRLKLPNGVRLEVALPSPKVDDLKECRIRLHPGLTIDIDAATDGLASVSVNRREFVRVYDEPLRGMGCRKAGASEAQE
jgi:hypothetical protein